MSNTGPRSEDSKPGPKPAEKRGHVADKSRRPKMPEGMSPVAEAKWRELTKALHRRGTLTAADGTQLAMVCGQWSGSSNAKKKSVSAE